MLESRGAGEANRLPLPTANSVGELPLSSKPCENSALRRLLYFELGFNAFGLDRKTLRSLPKQAIIFCIR